MTTAAHEAWLAERQTGLGGSDAAVALGLSPFKTPYQLFLEKRGEIAPKDLTGSTAVMWGTTLEDAVLARYAEREGLRVRRVPENARHPQHPFMLANLDAKIEGERVGVEAKTTNVFQASNADLWGEPGTDQVPEPYLVQCQHYMAVKGYVRFDVALFCGTHEDIRIYRVPRNDALIARLIDLETAFWRCVIDGTPPAPIDYEDAVRIFPRSTPGKSLIATDEMRTLVNNLAMVKAQLKEFGEVEDRLKATLAEAMGDATAITDGVDAQGKPVPIVTWTTQSSQRFDAAALKADHPDLHASYLRESTARVMRVKKGCSE